MGRRNQRTQTPALRVRVAQVEAQVIESRLKGKTYDSIATEMHMSLRGVKLAFDRALNRIVLPLAHQAKLELLEKARALEAALWGDYSVSSDMSVRSSIAGRILACQQRQAALLGADVPSQLAVQLALAPPSNSDEATVRSLRENLSVEELRALNALSLKAAGKEPPKYIETTASNVTPPTMPPVSPGPSGPTIGETASEQAERTHRPSPPMFDDEPQPQAHPTAPQARTPWDDQIDQLFSEMSMRCSGEDDPNTAVYRARIEKLERLRDMAGDVNASRQI